jgi:hypothetical protein
MPNDRPVNVSSGHQPSHDLRRWCIPLGLAVILAHGPPALPASRDHRGTSQTIYSADFEAGAGPEWSDRSTDVTPIGGRRFLGLFENRDVALTLASLPAHTALVISFDLFVVGSWEGDNASCCGPDVWDLRVDGGETLLHTTFSNGQPGNRNDFTQTFPDAHPGPSNPPRSNEVEHNALGIPSDPRFGSSAVYRLTFPFAHSGSALRLVFSKSGPSPQGETWGLDNVEIAADPQVSVSRVTPSAICLADPSGSTDETVTLDLVGSGFDTGVAGVYFAEKTDGSGQRFEAFDVQPLDATSLRCQLQISGLRPNAPYFPFVETASGVTSAGYGPGARPLGPDNFILMTPTRLVWNAPSSAGAPPSNFRVESACEAAESTVARGTGATVAGYRIYASSRAGVQPSAESLYMSVDAAARSAPALPQKVYVVTAVYGDGVESAASSEVTVVPLVAGSVRIVSAGGGARLVVDGSGLSDEVLIYADALRFRSPARRKGPNTVVQRGVLENGQRIDQYFTPGRRVLLTLRSTSGATAQVRFVVP